MKIYKLPCSAASSSDDGQSARSDVALSHRQFGVCFIVKAHTLLHGSSAILTPSPSYATLDKRTR